MTSSIDDAPAIAAIAAIDDLRARVRGPVLLPGDDGLDDEISCFNLAFRHSPAVTVGATCADDVAAAVRHAAARGLRCTVQATGHGAAESFAGGVLVTTHRMRGLRIDPVARIARVGAGVRWAQVIKEAAPHGLAPMCGSSPQVGAVGFTLGGGIGPLGRAYGFAADHVLGLEVVTADGRVRQVSATQEPDLFWALRGGKGGFGIVTGMTVGLHAISRVHAGGVFFAAEDTAKVWEAYRHWVTGLPETTTTSIAMLRLPPLPELPREVRGRFVTHLRFTHLGSEEEARRLLTPMRTAAAPLLDTVREMPFTEIASVHMDPTDPMPVYDRGVLLRELTAETVEALLRSAGPRADVPLAMVEVRHLGGAMSRPAMVPNAVGGRDAAFLLYVIGAPVPELLADVVPACVDGVVESVRASHHGGTQINFHGPVRDRAALRGAWPGDVLERLTAIKETADPTGMFSVGASL